MFSPITIYSLHLDLLTLKLSQIVLTKPS